MPIKAVAFDVDGVLTDGSFWWGPNGEEWKRFHFADIMGLSLARKAGLVLALISGEESPLVDRLAAKMKIADVHKGCKDKAAALRALAAKYAFSLDEIGFMGDDVNDVSALEIAGLAAVPADARPVARAKATWIASAAGGNGAVRELLDMVLARNAAERAAGQSA